MKNRHTSVTQYRWSCQRNNFLQQKAQNNQRGKYHNSRMCKWGNKSSSSQPTSKPNIKPNKPSHQNLAQNPIKIHYLETQSNLAEKYNQGTRGKWPQWNKMKRKKKRFFIHQCKTKLDTAKIQSIIKRVSKKYILLRIFWYPSIIYHLTIWC